MATGGLEPGTSRPKVLGFTTVSVCSTNSSYLATRLEVWPLNRLKCLKNEITVALCYCYVPYGKPYDI